MKKKILGLILAILLGLPLVAISASTVTQTLERGGEFIWEVIFTITTDTDGSVDATDLSQDIINQLKGAYLMQVDAFPTPNGTAPDAADVILIDENGIDMLGSEDGGTTAYAGLNLIHATLAKSTLPNMYLTGTGTHVNYFYPLRGKVTLDVLNQATNSADITIILVFTK